MIRLALIIMLGCCAVQAQAADQYTARFVPETGNMEVTACFDGAVPRQLYRHEKAGRYSDGISLEERKLPTRSYGSTVRLPTLPDNSCIHWTSDLSQASRASDYQTAFQVGGTIVASTQLWFWKGSWQRPVEVTINLPQGYQVSVPWKPLGGKRFTPYPTRSSWTSRTAIGKFHQADHSLSGGEITVSVVGSMPTDQISKLESWVTSPLQSVNDVFGVFPQPTLQVLVIGIGRRNEAVPWARVLRGGGPAVEFYVDETRPAGEFDRDWTATHEFSHLLLPYVSSRDRWLSEGLASYYQNVLRARNGSLSATRAWQKLDAGFSRGKAATSNETLAEATRSGRNSTMRVYWAGAAMMLEADTQLRAASSGQNSLDTALAAFHRCCHDPSRRWRARDLLAELDRITGTSIFVGLYRDYVDERDFPDLRPTYQELGLVARRGSIQLRPGAPLARVREGIMQPNGNDLTGDRQVLGE